jgi:hypothetical protein
VTADCYHVELDNDFNSIGVRCFILNSAPNLPSFARNLRATAISFFVRAMIGNRLATGVTKSRFGRQL